MKKVLFVIAITMLLIGSGCTAFFSRFGGSENNPNESTLHWVPEKSHFAEYEIVEDKIRFVYEIYFVNESDEDAEIMLSASFKSSDLKGWVKNQNSFICLNSYERIEKDESKAIRFTFEGDYLGGEVNENLSLPEELIIMTK